MKKSGAPWKRLLIFCVLILWIVIYALVLYRIECFRANNGVEQLLPYARGGSLRYNFVPLRNYFILLRNGYGVAAFTSLLGLLLVTIPMGVFVPLLHKKNRSYLKTMLHGWLCVYVLLALIYAMTSVGQIDIDDIIISFAGVSIGYGIWHFWIPKDTSWTVCVE